MRRPPCVHAHPCMQLAHGFPFPFSFSLPLLPQELVPGETGDVGFKQAMQHKWLATDKSSGEPMIMRKVRLSTRAPARAVPRAASRPQWARLSIAHVGPLPMCSRPCNCMQVDSIEDKTLVQLNTVAAGTEISKAEGEALKKRKLVKPE